MRWRPGTASRRSSARLLAISVCWSDKPVTLPPGRARVATKPPPTGSPATGNTIGIADVACFTAGDTATGRDDDIDLEAHEFGCDLGVALGAALRPSILDRDRAALDPAAFAQPLHEGTDPMAVERRRARTQVANGRQLRRLLRARRERPSRRRAAEECDEVASFHLATSIVSGAMRAAKLDIGRRSPSRAADSCSQWSKFCTFGEPAPCDAQRVPQFTQRYAPKRARLDRG